MEETIQAIASLAVKFSNIYTGVIILVQIFGWVAMAIIMVDLMNLLFAAVARRVAAYHQLVKPMADQLGYDKLFYTDYELEEMYRIFLRGYEAEKKES